LKIELSSIYISNAKNCIGIEFYNKLKLESFEEIRSDYLFT
jgi:hypothetical protein